MCNCKRRSGSNSTGIRRRLLESLGARRFGVGSRPEESAQIETPLGLPSMSTIAFTSETVERYR